MDEIMKKGNLLYIHIPRTAGTYFEKSLGFKGHNKAPRCGSREWGACYEQIMGWDVKTRIMLQHASYSQLIKHDFISPENNLIKVTISRNPYSRTVSLFKYFGGETKWKSFEGFLTHLETGGINGYFYMPQWKYISVTPPQLQPDFEIIKFENFSLDVQALNKKHNLKIKTDFDSEKHVKSSKRVFNKYYKTEEITQRVSDLYEKDFETFNYTLLS